MTTKTKITNKISSTKKYLKILKEYSKLSKETIKTDLTIKGAVERYLYLAVQSTIDLAEAVVAFKKYRKPTTMSEVFYILEEEKFISKKLGEKLVKMVGFRNIIAHDYEKIDYDILLDVLKNKTKDIEQFIKIVKNKIKL